MPVVDLSLEGKVAIVTGGSKGIGRAIALAFAEHGADVAIAARGAEALDRTRGEIAATGRRALAVQADMEDDEDVENLYRETVAQLGGVDILVNNAAVGGFPSLHETTQGQFFKVMKVNVWTPLNLSRLCRESMIERGGGVIINIVSNEGLRPSIGIGVYAPSKAALINMAQLMAKEWVRDGIRATCIAPGLIRTELAQRLVDAVESSGHYPSPQGRIGEAHEIAGMALLLASPAGSYTTGETYVVDGGEICSGAGDMMLSG
ncbi:MAG: SDR family NAD(P)-dependent oxidoreductase [Dehalococcoidia bacterium]